MVWGNDGLYNTNIDRIANEGIMFTDHYAQPSCTAGRAANYRAISYTKWNDYSRTSRAALGLQQGRLPWLKF
jgi:hypothetical protein